MLYHTHEFGRIAMQPARMMAEAGEMVFTNPYNPWSHTWFGKTISASCHVFESTTRRFGKPKFGLDRQ